MLWTIPILFLFYCLSERIIIVFITRLFVHILSFVYTLLLNLVRVPVMPPNSILILDSFRSESLPQLYIKGLKRIRRYLHAKLLWRNPVTIFSTILLYRIALDTSV